jgi:hypothetical protein
LQSSSGFTFKPPSFSVFHPKSTFVLLHYKPWVYMCNYV